MPVCLCVYVYACVHWDAREKEFALLLEAKEKQLLDVREQLSRTHVSLVCLCMSVCVCVCMHCDAHEKEFALHCMCLSVCVQLKCASRLWLYGLIVVISSVSHFSLKITQ